MDREGVSKTGENSSTKGEIFADQNIKENLHNRILRDKFLDLSKNLENEISSVIKNQMKTWREENLYPGIANSVNLENESMKVNKRSKKNSLPSRVFVPQQSLLNELFAVNHIQSVYNIFAAILFILFLHEVLEEVTETGRINLELSLLYFAFAEFDKALIIWFYMKSSTVILVYLGFHFWAHSRHKYPYILDLVGTILYAVYFFYFIIFPVKAVLANNLGIASSIAVLAEQVRMLMKTWAFVWANINRVLRFKKFDDDSSSSLCPNFSHYVYFLFAPTLVYRDEYPRNATCNWRKVAKEFAQVIGCLIYAHFLFARFCGPVFRKFGMEEFSHTRLIKAGFSSCFPGFLILLCGFFLILHSWMNAFAEMLRFADRMFYKDWWNSTSYPRFYRTWNCIVHDWLYEYIYEEISGFLSRQPKDSFWSRLQFLPMLVVFFVSSVVHEYILSFAFRFFYPVLLIMFGGFGVLFMFINTKESLFNIFIWASLILGTGMLMCLYSMEWYARINCSPLVDGVLDYFVPRTWFCFQN